MIERGEQKLVMRRFFRNGRRRYHPASKARLVAKCLLPDVSVSRVALDNGVNANLLRKWIKEAKVPGSEGVASPPAFITAGIENGSLSTEMAATRDEMCLAAAEKAAPFSITDQLHIEVKTKVLRTGKPPEHPTCGPIAAARTVTSRLCCSTIGQVAARYTHLGYMAHARRRFVNALKAGPKPGGPPEQALKFFEQLYTVEKQARNEKPNKSETQADCIRRFRQQHSIPVLSALKQWQYLTCYNLRRPNADRQQPVGTRHQTL